MATATLSREMLEAHPGRLRSTAMSLPVASMSASNASSHVPGARMRVWPRRTWATSADRSASASTVPTSALPPAAYSGGRRNTSPRPRGHRCRRAESYVWPAPRSASATPTTTSTAESAPWSAGAVRKPVPRYWTRSRDDACRRTQKCAAGHKRGRPDRHRSQVRARELTSHLVRAGGSPPVLLPVSGSASNWYRNLVKTPEVRLAAVERRCALTRTRSRTRPAWLTSSKSSAGSTAPIRSRSTTRTRMLRSRSRSASRRTKTRLVPPWWPSPPRQARRRAGARRRPRRPPAGPASRGPAARWRGRRVVRDAPRGG